MKKLCCCLVLLLVAVPVGIFISAQCDAMLARAGLPTAFCNCQVKQGFCGCEECNCCRPQTQVRQKTAGLPSLTERLSISVDRSGNIRAVLTDDDLNQNVIVLPAPIARSEDDYQFGPPPPPDPEPIPSACRPAPRARWPPCCEPCRPTRFGRPPSPATPLEEPPC